MSLYEFDCERCGVLELIIPVSEIDKPQTCPNCKSFVKKKLSIPSIVFKGSGFYCVDSKGPSVSAATNSNTSPSGSTPNTSTSSSDGKFKVKRT